VRARYFFLILIVCFLATSAIITRSAHASADVALGTYVTSDGTRNFIDDGGTMPLGSTLEIQVFVSLDSCDPVTVHWGDGTSEVKNYGSSLVENWYHIYNSTGTYAITAYEPCGGGGQTRSVVVGSTGLAIFDPSGPLFIPTLFGLILGLIGLAMALGPRIPIAGAGGLPNRPSWQPHLQPVPVTTLGTPPSMTANLVSYRDIPPGAPRQPDPRLKMVPGQATDVNQLLKCACGGQLGFAAGGWFCLNPDCPLRPKEKPWPRIVHGL